MRGRWLRAFVLSVLLFAVEPTAAWAEVNGSGVVVLGVGSNNGVDTEYPLRFAAQDAERFVQVMGELGDVERDDLHLVVNPSKAEFLQELSRVRDRSTPEGMLIVYFSGHGSTHALHVGGQKLNVSELHAAILRAVACVRTKLVLQRAAGGGRGPALTLSYAYGLSGWAPAMGLTISRLRANNDVNWVERDDLQASAGARYATFIDSFSGTFGLSATLNVAQQELVSRATDAEGKRRTDSSAAVGHGLAASTALQLPLLSWLRTDVGSSGSLLTFGDTAANARTFSLAFGTSTLLSMGSCVQS